MSTMETGRYLERIPYVKGGSGEKTIIILPGSFDFVLSVELDPKAAYKRYMSLLPGGYKFCILGYDRNLPDTATLESMADEFASIIKENFDTPVTLAGASYGGSISVYLASRHPELVERLLLFSSAHKLAKPAGLNFLKLVIEAASSLDVKPFENAFHMLVLSRIKRMLLPLVIILQKKSFLAKMNPASTVVNAYNLLLDLDGDLTGEFKKVKVDTWIIGGSKDPLFTREIFDEAKEIKKDFHLKIIEGAGHLLDMDKPKEFKKVIHEILSS